MENEGFHAFWGAFDTQLTGISDRVLTWIKREFLTHYASLNEQIKDMVINVENFRIVGTCTTSLLLDFSREREYNARGKVPRTRRDATERSTICATLVGEPFCRAKFSHDSEGEIMSSMMMLRRLSLLICRRSWLEKQGLSLRLADFSFVGVVDSVFYLGELAPLTDAYDKAW